MEFTHRDAPHVAAGSISLGPVRDHAKIDEDGVFEVDEERDDFEDVVERLVEAGHEPLEDDEPEDENTSGDDPEDEEPPLASDFSETELVEMGRDELRPIAAGYENINGNAGGDELTEKLIMQRRAELESEVELLEEDLEQDDVEEEPSGDQDDDEEETEEDLEQDDVEEEPSGDQDDEEDPEEVDE